MSRRPANGVPAEPVPERFARWMVPTAVAEVAALAALTNGSARMGSAGVVYVSISLLCLALSAVALLAAAVLGARAQVRSVDSRFSGPLFLVGVWAFGVGTAAAFVFALTWTVWSP